MRHKTWSVIGGAVVGGVIICLIISGTLYAAFGRSAPQPSYNGSRTFWRYQCIDTMKVSRDEARTWLDRSLSDNYKMIAAQLKLVADSGASCVAIDTPYDAEFLPLLRFWVDGARAQHLRVWFRGNFSGWEGWFGYPAGVTPDQILANGDQFIRSNPTLFQDGDIFTLAPEAENGAAFAPQNISGYGGYRDFLLKEHDMEERAFAAIHKQVVTNWFSMSGGVAQAAMDRPTVNRLGGVVAIDHYVADANKMGEFIDSLNQKLGVRVVLGEWGAPIPDINGSMTPDEQAQFVAKLLDQMATRSQKTGGVNYWTLSGGSTQLVDDTLTPLPAYTVLKRFYRPAVIKGTVTDGRDKRLQSVSVVVNGLYKATTDKYGNYALLVPSGDATVQAAGGSSQQVLLQPGQEYTKDLTVSSRP